MLSSSGKACNNNNNGYAPFEYQRTLAECVAKCESRGCKAFTYFSHQSTDPTERGYCTTVTGDCKEYAHPRCGNGLCQIYVKATKSPTTSPTQTPTSAPTVGKPHDECFNPEGGTQRLELVLSPKEAEITGMASNPGLKFATAVAGACSKCHDQDNRPFGSTLFDCTACAGDSKLILTNLGRKSGWCNAWKGNCHTGNGPCKTCLEGHSMDSNGEVWRNVSEPVLN